MWKAVRCPAALALLLVAAGVALVVQGVRATLSAPASEDVEVVDAPAAIGVFTWGAEWGVEKASFAGRAMVKVLAESEREVDRLSGILASEDVAAEMAPFVGFFIASAGEDPSEAMLRGPRALQLVVRRLDGAFLGGLAAGFSAEELTALLRGLRASGQARERPSPLYTVLRADPSVVDRMVAAGRRDHAERCLAILREIESDGSELAAEVEARLSR